MPSAPPRPSPAFLVVPPDFAIVLGLLNLLLELDETKLTSLLAASEGSSPRLPSPFTGLLLKMNYDPVGVLDVVDEIWPSRLQPRRGAGRKMEDPLPLVCYLLPLYDSKYGTVANVSQVYRGLEADDNYRRECGYAGRLPSLSVFRKIAAALESNWSRFQGCALSSDTLGKAAGSRIPRF